MKTTLRMALRAVVLGTVIFSLTAASLRTNADTGSCSGQTITLPFTDVGSSPFFCQIAEAYFSGLSNGTSATTYSPGNTVPREQMAAFIKRTLDRSLQRKSRQAALEQFWTPTAGDVLTKTTVGIGPFLVKSDGADLWVADGGGHGVARIRASDGKLLETWSGATNAVGALVAKGHVFVTGQIGGSGNLYQIDPTQPPGAVTTLTSSLGPSPFGIAFDGSRIWTANVGGSVSIVTLNPLSVTNIASGFVNPYGMLYDGSNIWVTDIGDGQIKKLDASGNILQSLSCGTSPYVPVFDGTNIWVPNFNSSTITVVRAKDSGGNPLPSAFILQTLSGNGLSNPKVAAFDGQRILVTNTDTVSLWKSTDFTPLGSVSFGPNILPWGACSDGLNFWITLYGGGSLARF